MSLEKNEISAFKVYLSLILVLCCSSVYCFVISAKFAVEETRILHSISDTRYLLKECKKTCSSLEKQVNSLQVIIENQTETDEKTPEAVPHLTPREFEKMQTEVLSLSDKVTYLYNANKEILNRISNTWSKRLLNLLNTAIRITKIDN